MRFKVPQFIDIEDKIFGPFTFKQFAYLAGGAGLSYVFYRLMPLYVAVIFIIPTVALAAALTFIKINSKPFLDILQAFINYVIQTRLYVWKKVPKKKVLGKEIKKEEIKPKYQPKLSESKLKDISWGLDVLDMKRK